MIEILKKHLPEFARQISWHIISTIAVYIYLYLAGARHLLINSIFIVSFTFVLLGTFRYFRKDGLLDFSKYTFRTREEQAKHDALKNAKTTIKKNENKVVFEKILIGIVGIIISFMLV